MSALPENAVARFRSMYQEDAATGCFLWTRAKNRKGYGQIRINGKLHIASRLAWQLAHGPIPAGLMALHRCDTPSCVNPAHLFLGTNSDNQKDSSRKGRHWMKRRPHETTLNRGGGHICPRGEQCRAARLTESIVREIRRLHEAGVDDRTLASRYGVNRQHIYKLRARLAWRHVA